MTSTLRGEEEVPGLFAGVSAGTVFTVLDGGSDFLVRDSGLAPLRGVLSNPLQRYSAIAPFKGRGVSP